MAKHFLFSFCWLLFTTACLAHHSELDRFNKCQLDSINALEPDHRVESQAGLTETWNPNHPELQCAGVSLIRRTIDPNGLHLPSYSPSPQLIFIIQGKGVLGLAVPGCPETYEEPRSQSRQQQQQRDSHQKIRRFSKGDVIAIPPGIPYWTYNYGDEPLVAISLLDTSNTLNQLDSTPRVFYLGGNLLEAEFPETQEQHPQRHSSPIGRRGGQQQQEEESEEQNKGKSVLSGFSAEFLAHSLDTKEETAKKLQSPRDQRGQIVKVEKGLHIISSELQEKEQQEEEEEEEREQRHRKDSEREDEDEDEKEEQEQRHGKHSKKEEEDEDEPRSHESRKWKKHTEEKKRESHGRGGEKQEQEKKEEEEEEIQRQHSKGGKNGLEETICSSKIRENIARPSRADLYNPRVGRISTVNSLTLPILRKLRFSAEYVLLYRGMHSTNYLTKNGIYAPHWNNNANSLLYVIRGQGRVRIVNSQGNPVFDDKVRKGQLVVVPQNFVVAQQAGNEEGLEYVVFKTNDRAAVSHVKQVFRATPAEILANAFGLRKSEVAQIKYNGNRGPLVQPQSQPQSL